MSEYVYYVQGLRFDLIKSTISRVSNFLARILTEPTFGFTGSGLARLGIQEGVWNELEGS